ncbi:MAG: FHA domain-containing protein [Moritella sp.]|uniref:FHA domain-containing protein n=1 Tax=unclassified Moritella TaxID=2637987 RepID=UPI00031CEDEB|nr:MULTISPECIES: FHA domain-containing protein [unclassified Moritella]MBL1415824.1 FHA domain-containing protein [Moritella sp.]
MAKIINLNTEEQVTLMLQHLFGRHPNSSHTLLFSPDASRMHATIFWDRGMWVLQDSSSNGTYVNGKLIHRGSAHHLHLGDLINFASLSGDTWRIVDLSPPNSLLIPVTPGLPTVVLKDLTVLPNEDQPENTLYISASGHWVCESESGVSVLKTGDLVGSREQAWRFIEASATAETLHNDVLVLATVEQTSIQFVVSQNEEHVAMKLIMGEQEYDLGQRNHHYLLLILARKRLEDIAQGLRASEQGWIDKELLSKMLGQSENHINIQIYRFRKQIVKLLSNSTRLPQAIERRTREIRFAYDNVEITGGAEFIAVKSKTV